jgi:hypothetical protein
MKFMKPQKDTRSEERRRLDEQIACEPPKPLPASFDPKDAKPIEALLKTDDLRVFERTKELLPKEERRARH